MQPLNYHHLRYFYEVCRSGGVTKAANRLNVAASAVSTQLRQLEESLDHPLFDREHKSLRLTEAGTLTLEYAEKIFRTGDELRRVLGRAAPGRSQFLQVGAVSTLSRNFIIRFLQLPALSAETCVILQSGPERELLAALKTHRLDLVLANAPAPRGGDVALHSDLIDEQTVSLVGKADWVRKGRRKAFRFPEDIATCPLVLPGQDSGFRASFERLLDRHGIVPNVAAEADDMALLRLLAREMDVLALVPPVVVRDELENGILCEVCRLPEITERFYAITPTRQFSHPLLPQLLQAAPGKSPKKTTRSQLPSRRQSKKS
jgi:LysR family transcriptional activator of nhaA